MTFEPIYKEIFEKLENEGRMITLSQEETYRLEYQFAMGFAPIQEEFHRKHRCSRNYINKLESTTAQV